MTSFRTALCLLSIFLAAGIPPGLARDVEIRFGEGGSGRSAAKLTVYVADSSGGPLREIGPIDESGRVVDTFPVTAEPPKGPFRRYFVVPDDNGRWKLAKATNQAPPSAEALLADPEMLEDLAHEVKVEWEQDEEGAYHLVATPLPPLATLRMRVVDPGGKPLADHEVHLYAGDHDFRFSSRETVVWSGKTDGEGAITLEQFPGVHSFVVHLPGAGQTATGALVVDPGSAIDITLDAVAPYATISGLVDDDLLDTLTPNSRVILAADLASDYREAMVDAEGKFHLADVPITRPYRVKLKDGSAQPVYITRLAPGESRTGVVLSPAKEPTAEDLAAHEQMNERWSANFTTTYTLRGRVIDEQGEAMPGVRVFATMCYATGIRMGQHTDETITDEQGWYEFKEANFAFGAVSLVAYVPGRPLALGAGGDFGPTVRSHIIVGGGGIAAGITPAEELPKVLEQPDLVLPAATRGGKVRVKVIRDGKPVTGATVISTLEDYDAAFVHVRSFDAPSKALTDALQSSSTTDGGGIANFEALTPGLYTFFVGEPVVAPSKGPPGAAKFKATSSFSSIPVVAGKTREVSLTLRDRVVPPTEFRVEHVDGSRFADSSLPTFVTAIATGHQSISSSKFDDQGIGVFHLGQGMWQVGAKYSSLTQSHRLSTTRIEPYYAAEQQIAASRLAPRSSPLLLRARRVEPATIEVIIEDENGRPTPGVVLLDASPHGNFGGHDIRPASTAPDGTVTFQRVQSGKHKLVAVVPGWLAAPATLEINDVDLTGQWAVPQPVVTVRSGQTKTVHLRRQGAAYIRGHVRPAPPADHQLQLFLATSDWDEPLVTTCLLSAETGEFLIGPVLPGKHTAWIERYVPESDSFQSRAEYTFEVDAVGVHREDLVYEPAPIPDPQQDLSRVRGTIFRADGVTPVYAARVAGFAPGTADPQAAAWSDARGRFVMQSRSYGISADVDHDPPGSPREPVLVAWLPGELGGTVLPLPEGDGATDVKITLPPPAIVRGRVSVGGKSPHDLPATIRVAAVRRGMGKLDRVLSVETIADVDGNYELRGLSPGDYEVQAALDDIWMSHPYLIAVPNDRLSTQDLDLAIAAPGDIAQYRLLKADGMAMALEEITITSPELEGGLARQLRTPKLTTDSAGVLHVEGLSAGEHTIKLESRKSHATIRVPSLGSPMDKPVDLIID